MTEIVVISGKGGTGKTCITASLAMLRKNIVAVDCDVDAANLPIILKPKDYHTENFVAGRKAVLHQETCIRCQECLLHCRFDAITKNDGELTISESACDGCGLCANICPTKSITMHDKDNSRWAAGFFKNGHLVHARLAPGEENSGKLVNEVRQYAKKIAKDTGWDTILIDGPPGIGCPVISTLTGVNKVILVTEPSLSAFHDMKRLLSLTEKFKIPAFIIINKFDLNKEISGKIEKWCLENKQSVLGKIPFDEQLIEAMSKCLSIVEWNPDSPAGKAIQSIEKLIYKN